MFFIERLNLLCPLFGVSFKRGSTVLAITQSSIRTNNSTLTLYIYIFYTILLNTYIAVLLAS